MKLVIVPDSLADAINAKLDLAIDAVPDAATDREHLFGQLLDYFDVHGRLPEFTIERGDRILIDHSRPLTC